MDPNDKFFNWQSFYVSFCGDARKSPYSGWYSQAEEIRARDLIQKWPKYVRLQWKAYSIVLRRRVLRNTGLWTVYL